MLRVGHTGHRIHGPLDVIIRRNFIEVHIRIGGGLRLNFRSDQTGLKTGLYPQFHRQSFVKRLAERFFRRFVILSAVIPAEADVHRVLEALRGGNTFPVPSGRAAVNGLADPDRLDQKCSRLIFFFIFKASELDGLAPREVCTAHKVVGVRSDKANGLLA